jgi:endonuclease/exonuclease/phosphatase family metal-dependent hydrolase
MRVMTYNLLAGDDADAEERLQQATLLLQAAQPDVLALNECTLLAQAGASRLLGLERALGMCGHLALADSGYHVALLVRGGAIERAFELRQGFSHVALHAELSLGSSRLQVIATHLDPYSAQQRLLEAETLVGCIRPALPALVLGDLNAISPRDAPSAQPERWVARYRARHLDAAGRIDTRALECLEASGLVDVHAALHEPTEPTRPTLRFAREDRPQQRLDYVFASAALAATARSCRPYPHPLAQTASDHLPLLAELG